VLAAIDFENSFLIYFHPHREMVARELRSVLRSIKLSEQGVFVQASTLGSLEALLEFLKTSKIPVSILQNVFAIFKHHHELS
jgi:translation initiation factor IF-2